MKIEIPGIKDVNEDIKKAEEEIKKLGERLDYLHQKQSQLDRFRDLISPAGTGDYLVSIVKDVLEDLGIKTVTTPQGFPVDLLGNGFAFEITGLSKGVNVSSEKYNQCLRFLEGHQKGEKVVLIANTYKNNDTAERTSTHFSNVVAEHLASRHVCLLTAFKLYDIWKDVQEGKKPKDEALRLLRETDGVLQ